MNLGWAKPPEQEQDELSLEWDILKSMTILNSGLSRLDPLTKRFACVKAVELLARHHQTHRKTFVIHLYEAEIDCKSKT